MATIEKSIDVEVPVSAAYDQWTQFEEFPKFMEGVVAVKQLDDSHVRWVAEIAGERQEWDAEIVEQEPDRVIAWRSTDGLVNRGRVEFLPIATGTARERRDGVRAGGHQGDRRRCNWSRQRQSRGGPRALQGSRGKP